MPVDLAALAAPGRSAVLTMEIQRGVVGDLTVVPPAGRRRRPGRRGGQHRPAAARRPGGGVPVVHCTAEFRADRAGSAVNCQLIAAMVRNPDHLLAGTPADRAGPELGPEPSDLVCPASTGCRRSRVRRSTPGCAAWASTTVVATGVSVNLGVLGLAIEACNLGYQVVVPRDAVAGIPDDYADAVLDNTFPLIATVTTTDELLAAWATAA